MLVARPEVPTAAKIGRHCYLLVYVTVSSGTWEPTYQRYIPSTAAL